MPLFIGYRNTDFQSLNSQPYEIGCPIERCPLDQEPSHIVAVKATERELQYILQHFQNIPYTKNIPLNKPREITWPQPWADFIIRNLDWEGKS